jgi:dihydrofolate synthase/folylpolyglutamate synthase
VGNAAIAIAMLRNAAGFAAPDTTIERGLRTVDWPARMQRLMRGPIVDAAPKGAEVWLDGGHNPHCAAAIAQAVADLEERAPKPLYLICGMLRTKDAAGFLAAFRGLARHVSTLTIPGEDAAMGAGALYDEARAAGLDATPAEDLADAMMQVMAYSRAREGEGAPRILICGSLYLAGRVLTDNG